LSRELAFRGERQDLEEMAGNLIDNACKWASARVSVSAARAFGYKLAAHRRRRPGLAPEERQLVGERGERLDESVPGTGLGLAIVRDIAKLYGGGLRPILRRGTNVARAVTPLRLFCKPFEDLLVSGPRKDKQVGRIARGSIPIVWKWLARTLLPAEHADYVKITKAAAYAYRLDEANAAATAYWTLASARCARRSKAMPTANRPVSH
jgi:hypothetical protein